MSNGFKDYYSPFKDETNFKIDPSLSREENYEGFKSASVRYSKLYGKDVELAMVREALGIFDNPQKYQEYRRNYVSYKLETYIEGAKLDDNTLPKNKYINLITKATSAGIAEAEVRTLLESLNIKVVAKTKPRIEEDEKVKNTKEEEDKRVKDNEDKKAREFKKIFDERRRNEEEDKKKRKRLIKRLVISGSAVILILIGVFFVYPQLKKQGKPKNIEMSKSNATTLDLTLAISYLDIQPPEYRKIEEAVKAFMANIDKPGSKEGLIKAADIYVKWGDDTPNLEEIRSMYKKALECSSAANGSRTEEIKSKIEELSNY